ncbi:universal stress protein [Streptomyces sp. NPDC058424]|uniref:universal stress protein n=1 Tax=Streptomyces sp. NPDC058424 TaxID=3346491 RepID=UPI0036646282
MFKSILVAVDPSPARHCAVRTAGELARLTGAEVHVVHVAASTIAWDTVVPLEEYPEADEILKDVLGGLREMGVAARGVTVDAMTRQIPSVISLAVKEAGADLVVLSPHHRGAVAAFFNPRVSDAVSHTSPVAVLLAPEAGPDQG